MDRTEWLVRAVGDMGQGVAVNWISSFSIDWGSVPDWVGGIGTAGSLILVSVGLRREIRRQRGEEDNSKAAQARLVYAKVKPLGEEVTEVTIRNASTGPVFQVEMTLVGPAPDGGRPVPIRPAPAEVPVDDDGRMDAGEVNQFYVTLTQDHQPQRVTGVDLSFIDQAGIPWTRRLGSEPPEMVLSAPPPRWAARISRVVRRSA
jgi:hypothetical protein